jgi:hypothetical protein
MRSITLFLNCFICCVAWLQREVVHFQQVAFAGGMSNTPLSAGQSRCSQACVDVA